MPAILEDVKVKSDYEREPRYEERGCLRYRYETILQKSGDLKEGSVTQLLKRVSAVAR